MRKPKKKPRRSLIINKDDEENEVERTNLDDLSQFRVATLKNPQNVNDVCENVRGSVGLSSFQYVNYDKLRNEIKKKIEEVVIDIMVNFKYVPIELVG